MEKVNKYCEDCEHDCKQFAWVKVVRCKKKNKKVKKEKK